MQFQLPSNLQQHLAKYDPELKKTISNTTTKTSRSTLGLPDDLIPAHIIRKEEQLEAVTYINGRPIEQRLHIFRKNSGEINGIIYHLEKLWLAAWLPNPGEDYVYGITFAFKPGEYEKIKIPFGTTEKLFNKDTVITKKYGRVDLCSWTKCITIDDITTGFNTLYWSHNANSYKQKINAAIKPAIKLFTNQLRQTIPHWKDDGDYNLFGRLDPKRNNYRDILCLSSDFPSVLCLSSDFPFVPGVELYKIYLDDNNKYLLDKPWFKRYINTESQKIIDAFNHPDTKSPVVLLDIHKDIKHMLGWINKVLKIWPACPVDYLQTAISNNTFKTLSMYSLYHSLSSPGLVHAWLNTYLPVESFFKIITKYTEEWLSKCTNYSQTTKYRTTFNSLRDTITMLDQILTAGETIDPPKRWRIEEFHDHIQTKAWTIKNPNQELPQDLFPTPIKVLDEEQNWTFFQPKDTHQLSQWGQAVRNCVGTAEGYANSVKSKKAFIVLCMYNNKPLFTVLLKVSNGVMHVDQIVSLSNARLTDIERNLYEDMFSKALQLREEELKLT